MITHETEGNPEQDVIKGWVVRNWRDRDHGLLKAVKGSVWNLPKFLPWLPELIQRWGGQDFHTWPLGVAVMMWNLWLVGTLPEKSALLGKVTTLASRSRNTSCWEFWGTQHRTVLCLSRISAYLPILAQRTWKKWPAIMLVECAQRTPPPYTQTHMHFLFIEVSGPPLLHWVSVPHSGFPAPFLTCPTNSQQGIWA